MRTLRTVVALALLLCAVRSARAHRRDSEPSRLYTHGVFAVTGGLGTYDPASSDGTAPNLFGGVRFIKPYAQDATYDFSSTQFSLSRDFHDPDHVATFELSFSNYLPRTDLFTFDHHFFYGAGLATALVERTGQETLALPAGTFLAGLQSRLPGFDLESSVKLVVGPRRHVYDASGMMTQIAIVYPLGE